MNGWIGTIADIAGYGGASLIALAYLLNQSGRLLSQDWRYPAINLVGSLMVLLSLAFALNPPSVVIELFWSAISIYGVQRNLRARRKVAAP